MAVPAAIVGAVVAAGSATYSIDQSQQGLRTASQKADAAKQDQAALLNKQAQQAQATLNQQGAVAAKNRTDMIAKNSLPGQTLLTSPIGATQAAQTSGKTLLGV